jgi:hypothetical protein
VQFRHLAGPSATCAETARDQGLSSANEFLQNEYVAEFNSRFAVNAAHKGSAFVRARRRDLDWIFSVQHERTVEPLDGRLSIRYGPHGIALYLRDEELPSQAPKRPGTPRLPTGRVGSNSDEEH